jgi:hypothetical protein
MLMISGFVLAVQILEALGLVELQTAVHPTPAVVRLLRDPNPSADRPDGLTLAKSNLRLTQQSNDLLVVRAIPASSIEVANSRIRSFNLASV